MQNMKFSNLIAPVFTPFDYKKQICVNIIPEYAKYLKQNNIHAILVNGTSGEGMSLAVAERKRVAEFWIDQKNYMFIKHIMVQVGGAALPDVLELAKHAETFGADSILCLPDLYMKPNSVDELIDYLKIVGDAAPRTPLLYYHIPKFTNVNIHMGDFLRSVGNRLPTLVGIKFTSDDLAEGLEALKAEGGAYKVFLDSDTQMLEAYALGFEYSIATTLNIYPGLCWDILASFKGGDKETARIKQDELSEMVWKITRYGSWVASMKAAMKIVGQIDCGPVRDPMKTLPLRSYEQLNCDLKKKEECNTVN